MDKKLLGAVRLSRLTDESTSPERQREQIALFAKAQGNTLVKIVQDLDISGSVSVWNRDLKPYLEDPKLIATYDGIIVAKLDRLTRNLLDFQRLLEWCREHDKIVISVSEGFDLSTPFGKMSANILVIFAEFERARMSERRSEAAIKLRGEGYYQGEGLLYGYKKVKKGDRYLMVPDKAQTGVVNWIADQIIAGKSQNWIAGELNRRGTPTSRNGKWNRTTIRRILRSSTINGQIVVLDKSNGKPVERVILGDDGMPLRREHVLDDDKWAAVLAKLDSASVQWVNRNDASALLAVAYCGNCGKSLYGRHQTTKGRQYSYYDCSAHCGARRIPMAALESAVDDSILDAYGWIERTVRHTRPGKNHDAEIVAIGQQMATLTSERFVKRIMRDDYDALMAQLGAEHARLSALESEPDTVEIERTGVTIAEWWPTLDAQSKRRYLMERGTKALATRAPDGLVSVILEGGEFYEDIAALRGITVDELLAEHSAAIEAQKRARGLEA